MGNYYIHVGSVTNAMRGKQILTEQGMHAYLHRASRPTEGDGCGYSLLVTGDVQKAEQALRRNGVRVIRVSEAL